MTKRLQLDVSSKTNVVGMEYRRLAQILILGISYRYILIMGYGLRSSSKCGAERMLAQGVSASDEPDKTNKIGIIFEDL